MAGCKYEPSSRALDGFALQAGQCEESKDAHCLPSCGYCRLARAARKTSATRRATVAVPPPCRYRPRMSLYCTTGQRGAPRRPADPPASHPSLRHDENAVLDSLSGPE